MVLQVVAATVGNAPKLAPAKPVLEPASKQGNDKQGSDTSPCGSKAWGGGEAWSVLQVCSVQSIVCQLFFWVRSLPHIVGTQAMCQQPAVALVNPVSVPVGTQPVAVRDAVSAVPSICTHSATPGYHLADSSGCVMYCSSMSSNSRARNRNWPGEISFRNALPTWPMPVEQRTRKELSRGQRSGASPIQAAHHHHNTKGKLLARCCPDVGKLNIGPLGCLWPQVRRRSVDADTLAWLSGQQLQRQRRQPRPHMAQHSRGCGGRPDLRLEHQVKDSGLGQSLLATVWARNVVLQQGSAHVIE